MGEALFCAVAVFEAIAMPVERTHARRAVLNFEYNVIEIPRLNNWCLREDTITS